MHHESVLKIAILHSDPIVGPRVSDGRDNVRGWRVIWASLLHIVHQRSVLFTTVEARLLTTRHTAPIARVHLIQVVDGLA